MTPDRDRLNWDQMKAETSAAEGVFWQKIIDQCREIDPEITQDARSVSVHGYLIKKGRFENFPPRILVYAEVQSENDANRNGIDKIMTLAAEDTSREQRIPLRVSSQGQGFGYTGLEDDPMYGRDPKILPEIEYTIAPDRDHYKI